MKRVMQSNVIGIRWESQALVGFIVVKMVVLWVVEWSGGGAMLSNIKM